MYFREADLHIGREQLNCLSYRVNYLIESRCAQFALGFFLGAVIGGCAFCPYFTAEEQLLGGFIAGGVSVALLLGLYCEYRRLQRVVVEINQKAEIAQRRYEDAYSTCLSKVTSLIEGWKDLPTIELSKLRVNAIASGDFISLEDVVVPITRIVNRNRNEVIPSRTTFEGFIIRYKDRRDPDRPLSTNSNFLVLLMDNPDPIWLWQAKCGAAHDLKLKSPTFGETSYSSIEGKEEEDEVLPVITQLLNGTHPTYCLIPC